MEGLLVVGGEAVVVVDNGRGGPEIDAAAERVRVVRQSRNEGFGAGCNRGAREADADVLIFLNPDTVARPGAIAALVRALEDPTFGTRVSARARAGAA